MNGFNGFSLKEKLSNIWNSYRKYIIIISIVILVMLIVLIIVLSNKNNKQGYDYELIESVMVYSAKKYIENNEITKDMYISLNYLNIEIDSKLKCNSNSGVLVEDNSYTPYLMCEGYNSQVVANVIKENEENSKYGVLLGDNPYIVTDTYQELGISLVEGYTVNIKDSNIDNGVNKVTYNILESGSYITHIDRIVIAEGILGSAPIIELVGNQTRTLEINTQYIESGYTATDKIDGNITDKVNVDGSVDTSKAGTYTLTYSVTNTRGKSASVKRKVIVNDNSINLDITHTISPTEVTSTGVKITLDIKGEGYSYTITDNGEKVTSKNPTYTAYKNGTYEFTVYDTNNNSEVYSVEIKNASVLTLTGNCKAVYENDTLTITNEIVSNNEVNYYVYKSRSITSSNTKEKELKLSSNVKELKTIVYDIYGSSKEMTCSVSEIYNHYIFTGDSRTVGMKDAVSNIAVNSEFICKGATDYNWFSQTAVPQITSILKSSNTKYYIYILFGVNDAATYEYYGSGEKALAFLEKRENLYITKLNYLVENDWSKAKVVFVSGNPVVDSMTNYTKNKTIMHFNQALKSGLSNKIFYCDTYNALFDGLATSLRNRGDGVHYSTSGYKLIYNYILKNCRF